ncbi:PadR family transcriptional regulator [Bacteroidota bacterium]
MKVLSSVDEILLLAVFSLAGNAYGVTIRQKLTEATGKNWTLGAVYEPLYRLEKKGYLKSSMSPPTADRGGRSKRMFQLTKKGIALLQDQNKLRTELGGGLLKALT